MTGQPIWRERLQGVGVHHHRGGASPSAPPARSCARPATPGTCAATCRTSPTTRSTSTSSSARYGDCFDRYAIRLNEIRESIRIVRQILDAMPDGRLPHPGQEGHAAAAGPHRRVDGSADPPLQDLHRGLQGARGRGLRAPSSRPAASSAATSSPTAARKPYRMHIRGPSFVNLQTPAAHDARRPHRRRRGRHLLGRPDHGRGRPLMAAAAPPRTIERVAARDHRRATRVPEVRADPAAAPRPGAGRLGHRRRHGAHRRAGRASRRPRCSAPRSSTRCSSASRSGTYVVNVCTNISCLLLGGDELLEHAEQTLGIKAGGTTADGLFTLEDVECIAACTEAPCLQVNYRYFHRVSHDEFDQLVDDLRGRHARRRDPAARHAGPIRQHIPADRAAGVVVPDRRSSQPARVGSPDRRRRLRRTRRR